MHTLLLALACQSAALTQHAAAQSNAFSAVSAMSDTNAANASSASAAPAIAPVTATTAAAGDPAPSSGSLRPNTMAARVAACTACHGEQGRAGADGYYPRLAGKPQDYLYQQLLHFRDGDRIYRPMTHLLAPLPDAYLYEIAGYFAAQHAPYPAPARGPASSSLLERGRMLTQQGDPARDVPACVACHGARLSGLAPAIPGLLGLPRDYIGAQIGSWRGDLRRAAEPDCMAEVSKRLTPEDVAAVAAWLSSLPVPEPYAPEAAASLTLPLACGSQTFPMPVAGGAQ